MRRRLTESKRTVSRLAVRAAGGSALGLALVLLLGSAAPTPTPTPTTTSEESMEQSILVHITHGPEHPTRAALGFNVARAALEQGHAVSVFLAGDAVQLLREGVLDQLQGLGTGTLRGLYDGIVEGGGRFYLSGGSSRARGLTEQDLEGKDYEFAGPPRLVELSLEHDRMFTY